MTDDALNRIGNKNIDEKDLLRAIKQLSDVDVPASFWNAIANSNDYSERHRAYCILELFRRFVFPEMDLDHLARLLKPLKWLRDDDIRTVTMLEGEIPLTWTLEDTVFVLRIFPDPAGQSSFAIYLRVAGKISCDDFIRCLRGKPLQVICAAVIREIGISEPYRHVVTD
jgi:hypothetical protein